MGGANTGYSNEEVNPLGELRHTTSTNSTENNLIAHTTQVHELLSTDNRCPDIQQHCHAQQSTNTIFRDRRPDVPPLALELQRPRPSHPQPKLHKANCSQTTAAAPTSGAAALVQHQFKEMMTCALVALERTIYLSVPHQLAGKRKTIHWL
jgi:hypothetical protein